MVYGALWVEEDDRIALVVGKCLNVRSVVRACRLRNHSNAMLTQVFGCPIRTSCVDGEDIIK